MISVHIAIKSRRKWSDQISNRGIQYIKMHFSSGFLCFYNLNGFPSDLIFHDSVQVRSLSAALLVNLWTVIYYWTIWFPLSSKCHWGCFLTLSGTTLHVSATKSFSHPLDLTLVLQLRDYFELDKENIPPSTKRNPESGGSGKYVDKKEVVLVELRYNNCSDILCTNLLGIMIAIVRDG